MSYTLDVGPFKQLKMYLRGISPQPKAVLLALVLAVTATATQAQNKYWDEYGSKPVAVEQVNAAGQILNFTDFKDGMLVAELEGGVGEISLPLNESMVNTLKFDTTGLQKARNFLASEKSIRALNALRPKAYPLIKFSQIPAEFTQVHIQLQTLIEILIDTGELDEAQDILARIVLDKSPTRYSQQLLRLLNARIQEDNLDSVAQIVPTIPIQGDYATNISEVMNIADALRAAKKFKAVIPIYKRISENVSDKAKQNIQMWLAYSLVLDNRLDEATPIIDSLIQPQPNDRLFSLYKLLQGSRAYQQGKFGVALDLLTRGFVRAQTSYTWVPEMLFLIGDCYARSKDIEAARNVWSEIATLYPDSPWAEQATTSLKNLPKKS